MGRPTLIDVIEAAYDLDSDEESWSHTVAAKIGAHCGGNKSTTMLHFDMALPPEQRIFRVTMPGMGKTAERILQAAFRRPSLVAALEQKFGTPDLFPPLATLSSALGVAPAADALFAPFSLFFGFADLVSLGANDGTGRGLIINLPSTTGVSRMEVIRHTRKALPHLSAALRLRRSLSVSGKMSPGPEGAVLDTAGRLQDGALPPPLRERLREAVLARDRARTGQNRGSDQAPDGWTALVEGRWSLIDVFEENGRRYVVAHPNLPNVIDPRHLSPLERAVFSGLSRGLSNKAMGYELGLTEGTIAGYVRSLRHKLGEAARTASGPVATLSAGLELPGINLAILVSESPERELFSVLSPAERAVLLGVLAGHSNAVIARRRNVSVRTVAKQIASAYHKLGVSSRRDLMARANHQ